MSNNSILVNNVKWFQILFCITYNSIKHLSFVYTQLNNQTVIFLTIQFNINHLFALIKFQTVLINPYIGPCRGATTPGQSGPGNDGNEEILCIPQSSSITKASPSDCLMPYPGHTLGRVLPLCRDAVGVFYSPSRLGKCVCVCVFVGICVCVCVCVAVINRV